MSELFISQPLTKIIYFHDRIRYHSLFIEIGRDHGRSNLIIFHYYVHHDKVFLDTSLIHGIFRNLKKPVHVKYVHHN